MDVCILREQGNFRATKLSYHSVATIATIENERLLSGNIAMMSPSLGFSNSLPPSCGMLPQYSLSTLTHGSKYGLQFPSGLCAFFASLLPSFLRKRTCHKQYSTYLFHLFLAGLFPFCISSCALMNPQLLNIVFLERRSSFISLP